MAGLLVFLLLLAVVAFFVLRAVLKVVFSGVSKAGSSIAYLGTKAVKGEKFARENEKDIRQAGATVGVVGSILAVGEAVDIGGVEEGTEGLGTDNATADATLSGGESVTVQESSVPSGTDTNPVDIDGDGVVDGFDTNGDGVLDTNVIGEKVGDINQVEGYVKDDGTVVEPHARTAPDGSTTNNIRPEDGILSI